jgi:hypothetical protein
MVDIKIVGRCFGVSLMLFANLGILSLMVPPLSHAATSLILFVLGSSALGFAMGSDIAVKCGHTFEPFGSSRWRGLLTAWLLAFGLFGIGLSTLAALLP